VSRGAHVFNRASWDERHVELSVRENFYRVLEGEPPERIPWLIYSNLLPRGREERLLRNKGLGLVFAVTPYTVRNERVSVEERRVGDEVCRVYKTPVGEVVTRVKVGLVRGAGESWVVEYPIKRDEDYDVIEYMIEESEYEPNYSECEVLERDLGDDGVIFAWGDYTPLMKVIVHLMGFTKFSIEFYRNRRRLEELLKIIDRKEVEMYKIIAEAPVDLVKVGDNVDSMMISPPLFEKYLLPYYNKYASILHKGGKVVLSHMDGRLKSLKDLIAKTKLDIIEAFTPPPMGDLSIREAREAWRDKIIWINFPESTFVYSDEELRAFTLSLLREMAPGDGYVLSITEDPPPEHYWRGLRVVTETLWEYGKYPIRV